MKLSVIVLAAGKGTRMHSPYPKVLQSLGGVSLLERTLSTVRTLSPQQIILVHSEDQRALFEESLGLSGKGLDWVTQAERLGTGHAVSVALPRLAPTAEYVLILCADMPLVTPATLIRLLAGITAKTLHCVTGPVDNPEGLGRVLRDPQGRVKAIVEHRDASTEVQAIHEVNAGMYCVPKDFLCEAVASIRPDNRQNEYYLTDIVAFAAKRGLPIKTVSPQHASEILGVNTFGQLAQLERFYQVGLAQHWLDTGVHIIDPSRFDVRGDASEVTIAPGVRIDVNVILEGKIKLEPNVTIGPNVYLKDTIVRTGAAVLANSVVEQAEIGVEARVGPFARVRPGSRLSERACVGNFVEIKKTTLGKGSKINHLSYIGDAIVGNNVNIGAGTITCNYDGAHKHITVIEDNVFIGSDVQLIAPIVVEENATIGAGTTVTKKVEANSLIHNQLSHSVRMDWKRPEKASDNDQVVE